MESRAIVDSGFLVALWDSADPLHGWAADTARTLRGPWLTCEACVSETVFLLNEGIGPNAVLAFYDKIENGTIISRHLLPEAIARVRSETARYRGRIVDFADACLVTLSDEFFRLPVATVDADDFAVYFRGRSSRRLVVPNRRSSGR